MTAGMMRHTVVSHGGGAGWLADQGICYLLTMSHVNSLSSFLKYQQNHNKGRIEWLWVGLFRQRRSAFVVSYASQVLYAMLIHVP